MAKRLVANMTDGTAVVAEVAESGCAAVCTVLVCSSVPIFKVG